MATKGMAVFTHQGEDFTINDPNIADEFSTSKAYAKGDYCYYQGSLWRFTADHSAGSWAGSDAVSVKLNDEIIGIKATETNNKSAVESVSKPTSVSDSISNISTGNHLFMFDRVAIPGQTITARFSMDNDGRFAMYKVLSADGEESELVVPEAASSVWEYNVADNEIIYGIKIWIRTANSSKLTYSYQIINYYEALVTENMRTSIRIEETVSNITTQNYDYLFDEQIKAGQKLHIICDVGQNAQVNIYKILKKNDASEREAVLTYIHDAEIDILSTEDKPVWGIRFYVASVSSASESMYVNLRALSFDESADDYDDTKQALYKDINAKYEHTITDNAHYEYYFPYRIFPGQKLHYKASLTDGSFYMYKLFDRYDRNNRKVLPSAVSVRTAEGIITGDPNENFVGLYIWINSLVESSKLTVEFYAEGFRNEDIIIPRAEIEPILANLNYNRTVSNAYLEYDPFVIIHFSDVHGDMDEVKRISDFNQKYRKYFADVIHTGDAVLASFENPYPALWGESRFLQVVGNHDVWTNGTSGCKAWTTGYSPEQCYERYILPIASIIRPVENKCYWSKLYANQKIMMIAIDNFHWKETIYDTGDEPMDEYPDGSALDTGEQLEWFTARLQEARERGFGVIVASHVPAGADTKPCSFTSLEGQPIGGIPLDAVEAVQNYIEAGGEFITWLCGHTHYDYIGELTEHPDQSIIVIDTARAQSRPDGENWQENARVLGTRSENLFNIFCADRNKKYITLYRVGMNYDKFGRHIGELVYDYENKEVIWNS